jgi:hypothetical protein
VITDIAVERVEFRCPESHWQSVIDYDVVVYVDAEGDNWEFYSKDGVPSVSPYTVDGAPLCPVCHRVVVGTPVARRPIPVPPGDNGRHWHPVSDLEAHRAQRRNVPLLPSRPASHQPTDADPVRSEEPRSGEISRPAGTGEGSATRLQPGTP